MKYCIIVDSSSKISNGEIADVYVAPLTLTKVSGKQSFSLRDGVDIKTKQMLIEMQKGVEYKTASPVIGDCADLLDEVTKKYDEVYVLSLSKNLSGTFNQWNLLASDYNNVYPFNTNAIGDMVRWIVSDIKNLKDVNKESVGKIVEEYNAKALISVVVSDMKYLIKGGRVSSFKGFIAGLLKFKLVLALKKDGLKLVGKTTKVENVPELVEEAFKEETGYNGKDIEKLVIFTSNVVDNKFDASSTIDVLKNKFKGVNIEYSELPSVIAAHVGPSYVAIAIKVK